MAASAACAQSYVIMLRNRVPRVPRDSASTATSFASFATATSATCARGSHCRPPPCWLIKEVLTYLDSQQALLPPLPALLLLNQLLVCTGVIFAQAGSQPCSRHIGYVIGFVLEAIDKALSPLHPSTRDYRAHAWSVTISSGSYCWSKHCISQARQPWKQCVRLSK